MALDDFGTGYSALDRIGELNIDSIKIDKYFMDKLASSDSEAVLAGDIISIAHRFGYNVVAEGVEQQKQKDYLIKNGCDYMQGFLFSKPLAGEKAVDLLYKYKDRT
ncbi:MAG: EAL domain-containing protein [Actinomycetota bacterium]|nr:EAL domain-containing protein [Actinomycetota bacterium]